MTLRLPADLVDWVDQQGKRGNVVTEALEAARSPKRFALTEDNLSLIRAAVRETLEVVEDVAPELITTGGDGFGEKYHREPSSMAELRAICAGEDSKPRSYGDDLYMARVDEVLAIQSVATYTASTQAYNGGIPLAKVGNLGVLPLEDYPGRLNPECEFGGYFDLIEKVMQPMPADEGAWTNLELPPCMECGEDLRNVKGKWGCADASCPLYGKEQKIK